MPRSRAVTGLIAVALVAASGAGGVAAGEFVTGSMSGFYGGVTPRLRDAGPHVVTSEPPAPSPAQTYAPMPATYWSAAPALTDAPPPADDSRRWERESEAEARRWQAHIDREVRDAERSADPPSATDDAAPDQPSPDHGPAAPTLLPDQPPA